MGDGEVEEKEERICGIVHVIQADRLYSREMILVLSI